MLGRILAKHKKEQEPPQDPETVNNDTAVFLTVL